MFEINGETWFVKFIDPNDLTFQMESGEYTVGVCDDNTKTIYLASHLNGPMLKKVLCHEIVHAAMFSYDVFLDKQQEEILAEIIATYGEEIIEIANDMFKRLSM